MNIKSRPFLRMLIFMAFAYSLGGWAAIDTKEVDQIQIKKGQLSLSLMYKYKLANEPELLQAMVRTFSADPNLEKRLWSGIELSKHSPKPHITLFAINAVLVLKTMGRSFENRDFSHVHIPGADFSGAKMSGINLTGAHLPNAKFNGAILDHAFLQDANFAGATFVNANLTNTDFRDTCANKAQFFTTDKNPHHASNYASVNTVAFSPDKDKPLLAWGADSGRIHLVHPETGQEVASWQHDGGDQNNTTDSDSDDGYDDTGSIFSLQFAHDGKRLLCRSASSIVRVYSTATYKTMYVLRHPTAVSSCQYTPQGDVIICTTQKKNIMWWDAADGQLLQSVQHTHNIKGMAISPDGSALALINQDNTISLCDGETGKQIATLSGNKDGVHNATFVPTADSSYLMTANGDGTVTQWDIETKSIVATFDGHQKDVNSISFDSRNPRFFVSAGNDKAVAIWDIKFPQKPLRVLQGHTGAVWHAAILPSSTGLHVASASIDGTVRIYDVGQSNNKLQLNKVFVKGRWKPTLQVQGANFVNATGLQDQFATTQLLSNELFPLLTVLKLDGAVIEKEECCN